MCKIVIIFDSKMKKAPAALHPPLKHHTSIADKQRYTHKKRTTPPPYPTLRPE